MSTPTSFADAAVDQRFLHALVAVDVVGVLADDGDAHARRAARRRAAPSRATAARSGSRVCEAEPLQTRVVEALLVERERDLVDRRHVGALDHRAELDVAEERDLALDVVRQRPLGAADEEVGLDADLHQLAHRMLRRLRLHLAGGRDVRHQREVHEDRVRLPDLVAELADRLEERQRLDVADGAADLHDHDVVAGRDALDRGLDLVGDVRDDLHRRAEVLAAPLLA